jgi:hypothetical protein
MRSKQSELTADITDERGSMQSDGMQPSAATAVNHAGQVERRITRMDTGPGFSAFYRPFVSFAFFARHHSGKMSREGCKEYKGDSAEWPSHSQVRELKRGVATIAIAVRLDRKLTRIGKGMSSKNFLSHDHTACDGNTHDQVQIEA